MGTLLVSIATFMSLCLRYKGEVLGYRGDALSDRFKQTKRTPLQTCRRVSTREQGQMGHVWPPAAVDGAVAVGGGAPQRRAALRPVTALMDRI